VAEPHFRFASSSFLLCVCCSSPVRGDGSWLRSHLSAVQPPPLGTGGLAGASGFILPGDGANPVSKNSFYLRAGAGVAGLPVRKRRRKNIFASLLRSAGRPSASPPPPRHVRPVVGCRGALYASCACPLTSTVLPCPAGPAHFERSGVWDFPQRLLLTVPCAH
jgi:hypothetical protein